MRISPITIKTKTITKKPKKKNIIQTPPSRPSKTFKGIQFPYLFNIHRPSLEKGQMLTKKGEIYNRHFTRICREDISWSEFGEYLKQKYPNPNNVNFVIYGCSTGEEAYTFALLLNKIYDGANFKIKASDISKDIIENNIQQQKQGIYLSSADLEYMYKSMELKDYCDFDCAFSENIKIKKSITDKIEFSHANILTDIDTISTKKPTVLLCRNMWPYINQKEYNNFASKLYEKLHPDSIVVLGEYDYEGDRDFNGSSSFPFVLLQNGFKHVLYSKFQSEGDMSVILQKQLNQISPYAISSPVKS